jgi:hypothetical protein
MYAIKKHLDEEVETLITVLWTQHFLSMLIRGFDDQKLDRIYSWKKFIFFKNQKLQFTYP